MGRSHVFGFGLTNLVLDRLYLEIKGSFKLLARASLRSKFLQAFNLRFGKHEGPIIILMDLYGFMDAECCTL